MSITLDLTNECSCRIFFLLSHIRRRSPLVFRCPPPPPPPSLLCSTRENVKARATTEET